MKYILALSIALLIGCSAEVEPQATKAEHKEVQRTVSKLSRTEQLDQLACRVWQKTKTGDMEWQGYYKEKDYVSEINGNHVFLHRDGMTVYTGPLGNRVTVKVTNQCTMEMYDYLENNNREKLHVQKEQLIDNFLQEALE